MDSQHDLSPPVESWLRLDETEVVSWFRKSGEEVEVMSGPLPAVYPARVCRQPGGGFPAGSRGLVIVRMVETVDSFNQGLISRLIVAYTFYSEAGANGEKDAAMGQIFREAPVVIEPVFVPTVHATGVLEPEVRGDRIYFIFYEDRPSGDGGIERIVVSRLEWCIDEWVEATCVSARTKERLRGNNFLMSA